MYQPPPLEYGRRRGVGRFVNWNCWRPDMPLFFMVCLLACIGLLVLYSASNQQLSVVAHQGFHILLALACMFIFTRLPNTIISEAAIPMYLIGVGLLILVSLFGHVDHGARRWLSIAGLQIQPSEFMKLLLPVALAGFFARFKHIPSTKHYLLAAAMIALPSALILKQPDLGTAIMVASSGVWIVLLSGLPRRIILFLAGSVTLSLPLLWHHLHSYQKARVLTFLNPDRDPLGQGYHIIQSKIAIGSGGLMGKGWLHGTQTHLNFLPEHTTDFIFSVFSEEWGLIGGIVLLCLLCAIFLRCMTIAQRQSMHFNRLLCAGLGCSFLFTALVNIAMVSGCLPVVGVPLPFVSYGGSVMLTQGISFGMIMSMTVRRYD